MRSGLGVGVISFFLFPFSSQLITQRTTAYGRGAGVGRGEPVGIAVASDEAAEWAAAPRSYSARRWAPVLNERAELAAATELDPASVFKQASAWVSPSPVNWHGLSS